MVKVMKTKTRDQAPPGYDPSQFPAFAVTVDVVVLTMVDGLLHVLLVCRGEAPFEGMWAVPGGFKRPAETLDDAAKRELVEETGVDAASLLTQFGAYGDPERDPRMNVVTVAYLAVLRDLGAVAGGSDAAAAALIVSLSIVWTTTFGIGYFGNSALSVADRVLAAQVSILLVTISASVLAALFAETFTLDRGCAKNSLFHERGLYRVEAIGLDDGFNHDHKIPPSAIIAFQGLMACGGTSSWGIPCGDSLSRATSAPVATTIDTMLTMKPIFIQ